MDKKKLLVVQAAALGMKQAQELSGSIRSRLNFLPMQTVFPAVTCVAQATFRTGTLPMQHGVFGNGFYERVLNKALFWEQSSAIVRGPRFWDGYRARGKKVAMLFWQESLGENVDVLLSPAPIHKHGGGMVQSVHSKPADLYERLTARVGRRFSLHRYWGPLASYKASQWIAAATAELLGMDEYAPDLCMTYLPVLDYDLQRCGPGSEKALAAVNKLSEQLELLLNACDKNGYEMVVFGDYAIGEVSGAICPNKVLMKKGLFVTRDVEGKSYPDLNGSDAFCLADHEVGLVYAKSEDAVQKSAEALSEMNGIAEVIRVKDADAGQGTLRSRLGPGEGVGVAPDLILLADKGKWIAYPWWDDNRRAPDYARHVDIHNKPGYDPCELFFEFPFGTCLDTRRIKGSHGRVGSGREACYGSTFDLELEGATLESLSDGVKKRIVQE